ncbi:hypothetical protein RJT34_26064 [Clitoria ternatea]|uniref:Miraculin-like n=1 Tax=Clitoria ternatea TaxID=43366 RepID=A0AAN9F6D6_CLITE
MTSTLLALVLILFALSSQLLLASAYASPEEVVDTLGKKLKAGVKYYIIIPSIHPYPKCPTIGLGLAGIDEPCPLDVVAVNGYHGFPLTFTPINPKKGVIREDTDLNIKFSTRDTVCPRQSNVWKIDNFDFRRKQWFVTTGGLVGNPGLETIHNWFKIEKYNGAYKLLHCPTVLPNYFKHLCKNVGIFVDEKGNKRLALTDVPVKVKFQKA